MKVAIAVPCHGDTKAWFTESLARLTAATMKSSRGLELETFICKGSRVHEVRNTLHGWAIDWGADHVLWVDSDQTFPRDALLRLLLHKRPVVGANIRWRTEEIIPTALIEGADGSLTPVDTTPEKAASGILEEVASMGLGFCLVDMAAAKIQDPPFAMVEGGEDRHYFGKLRQAGVKLYVDHALSMEVGHIHETILTFPR
jgi:hypothetical protein